MDNKKSIQSVLRSRLSVRTTFGAAAVMLLAGCGGEAPAVEEPSAEELSGVNGNLAGSFIQAKVEPRDFAPKWDGSEDQQLLSVMRMSGAKRAMAFKTDNPAEELRVAEDIAARSRTAASTQLANAAETQYVGVVTAKGHYRLEFDAATLRQKYAGLTTNEGGSVENRGWSNASDQRGRRTGVNVPIVQGRVVTSMGTCSGASVGRRLVRTAAHCVVQHTTGGGTALGSATYEQARDGNAVRATDTTTAIIFGGNYFARGCGTRTAADPSSGFRANLANCILEDWAILILSDNWHSEANGTQWLGFSTLGTGDVGTDLESHGYPGCDDFLNPNGSLNEGLNPHDPAGCRTLPRSNYRDISTRCEIASFLSGTTSWRTGCDISPGNSGGPAIVRNTGNFLGNASWEDCSTCTTGNNAPNRYMGHNQFLFDFTSQLEDQNP